MLLKWAMWPLCCFFLSAYRFFLKYAPTDHLFSVSSVSSVNIENTETRTVQKNSILQNKWLSTYIGYLRWWIRFSYLILIIFSFSLLQKQTIGASGDNNWNIFYFIKSIHLNIVFCINLEFQYLPFFTFKAIGCSILVIKEHGRKIYIFCPRYR